MATLANLRTEVRRRVGEGSTSFLVDAELTSLLNEAQVDFASDEGILDADSGLALVAKQYEYAVPSNFINQRYLLHQEHRKLHYVSQRRLFTVLNARPGITGIPLYWTIWDKVIRLYPTPNASSASTAINDGAGISASVTTITVDSTSGFSSSGRALIENEEVHYFDLTSTTLLQCKRGQAGTTAATHADDVAVSEAELRLFYYKTPTAMSADADTPDIPTEYHDILVYYAAGMFKIKDRKHEHARDLLGIWETKKARARAEIRRRQRDRNIRFFPADSHNMRTRLGIP